MTHVTTTPYHRQSNRFTEHMVQLFEAELRNLTEGTISIKMARFLFYYRITPHSIAGIAQQNLCLVNS